MTRRCQRKSPVKSNVPTDMMPEVDEFVRDYHLNGRGDAFFMCFRIVRQILRILCILEKMIPMLAIIVEYIKEEKYGNYKRKR